MSYYTTKYSFNTAVLFLIFNRKNTAKLVFEEIRKAKPPRLYIASDGPRKNKEEEEVIVTQIREYILKQIDWDCEVKTLFRPENLGCGKAVSGAIDWFFENEEMGIILEDDCLPNQSFFRFCFENLERYKYDTRIAGITGDNFQQGKIRGDYSYYFSQFQFIWGWATWKRSWEFNKHLKRDFGQIKKEFLIKNPLPYKYSNKIMLANAEKALSGDIDTWDFSWIFSVIINNGLVITPQNNLVKNIGAGIDATHTSVMNPKFIIENSKIEFPLKHPVLILQDKNADIYLFTKILEWIEPWKKNIKRPWRLLPNSFKSYLRLKELKKIFS